MKLSEIIEYFQEIKERHGDLEVNIFEQEDGYTTQREAYVVVEFDEEGRVAERVVLTDEETAEALWDPDIEV